MPDNFSSFMRKHGFAAPAPVAESPATLDVVARRLAALEQDLSEHMPAEEPEEEEAEHGEDV